MWPADTKSMQIGSSLSGGSSAPSSSSGRSRRAHADLEAEQLLPASSSRDSNEPTDVGDDGEYGELLNNGDREGERGIDGAHGFAGAALLFSSSSAAASSSASSPTTSTSRSSGSSRRPFSLTLGLVTLVCMLAGTFMLVRTNYAQQYLPLSSTSLFSKRGESGSGGGGGSRASSKTTSLIESEAGASVPTPQTVARGGYDPAPPDHQGKGPTTPSPTRKTQWETPSPSLGVDETSKPTDKPVRRTPEPTVQPSWDGDEPTHAPTATEVVVETGVPVSEPSASPVVVDTTTTSEPTILTTFTPTSEPTTPTIYPTEATPTASPSLPVPTAAPSESPPTMYPTEAVPTVPQPSYSPSEAPPSLYPTEGMPSFAPSSSAPSNAPVTAEPSSAPSIVKTYYPTESTPTHFPTAETPFTSAPTVVSPPTHYPTVTSPTVWPTEIKDYVYVAPEPTKVSPPTAYPTDAMPSPWPTIKIGPTSSPVSVAPTDAPSYEPLTIYDWEGALATNEPTYEPTPSPSGPTESPTTGPPTVPDLDIQFKRDGYSKVDLTNEIMYYEFLKGYESIIEPYAKMLPVVADLTSDERYYWFSVCSETATGEYTNCLNNTMTWTYTPSFSVECEPFDTLLVTLTEYMTETGAEIRSAEGFAMCMYVRREIRQLTELDLNATMNAMHRLWEVTEDEGRELYGDAFHTNEYFVNYHFFNAAWQDSDHIHEGNGFLSQHIKITNMFELSMQSVDKSVTLPYWDFTIDSSNDTAIADSYIMTPEVFGTMNRPKDLTIGFTFANDSIIDGAIPDGRWAYTPVNVNTKFEGLKHAYGFLRSPWNQNPSPYLSRFYSSMDITLPDCGSHYTALQQVDLNTFTETIEAGPHAKTHVKLGGIFGCDLLLPMLEKNLIYDMTTFQAMCGNWVFTLKEFYRGNFLIPNDNCTAAADDDLNNSTCGFTCNDPDDTFITEIMLKLSPSVPDNMTRADWQTWKDFICEGDGQNLVYGEHLEAASPSDPSFWPIHPTLERLLQAKLMSGGFETKVWAEDPYNDYVCDKPYCFSSDFGYVGNFSDCCVGHFEHSQMYDPDFVDRSAVTGLTNGEVIEFTDPTNAGYQMPYIYADFLWDHCYETDHLTNFDALFVAMNEKYTRSPTSVPTSMPSVSFEPTRPTFEPTPKPSSEPTIKPTPTAGPTIPYPTSPPTTTNAPTPFPPTMAPNIVVPTPPIPNKPTTAGTPTAEPTPKPSAAKPSPPVPTQAPTKTTVHSKSTTTAPTTTDKANAPTNSPTTVSLPVVVTVVTPTPAPSTVAAPVTKPTTTVEVETTPTKSVDPLFPVRERRR